MSVSTVGSLDRTLQETHAWLQQLAQAEPFGEEEQANTGLRAVLHPLPPSRGVSAGSSRSVACPRTSEQGP
jgi:hypothetical protein